jgi:hypothetical protein
LIIAAEATENLPKLSKKELKKLKKKVCLER